MFTELELNTFKYSEAEQNRTLIIKQSEHEPKVLGCVPSLIKSASAQCIVIRWLHLTTSAQ